MTELKIELLGYNDFHYLHPYKFLHQQDFYTLHLVVNGGGTLSYKEHTYNLSRGDMFLLPPNTLFAYYPDTEDPWDYIFFEFVGTKIDEILNLTKFKNENLVFHCENITQILPSFKHFFKQLQSSETASVFEASTLFYTLLDCASDVPLSIEPTDIIEDAIGLIKLNFNDSYFTIEQLANELHCSHSQLCRHFKSKMGKTAIAYINELRINYAKLLLQKTSLSSKQIAQMSGFNEYTYFLLLFKRKTGLTTSEYRKQNKPTP